MLSHCCCVMPLPEPPEPPDPPDEDPPTLTVVEEPRSMSAFTPELEEEPELDEDELLPLDEDPEDEDPPTFTVVL